jgi:hypothetical protein
MENSLYWRFNQFVWILNRRMNIRIMLKIVTSEFNMIMYIIGGPGVA